MNCFYNIDGQYKCLIKETMETTTPPPPNGFIYRTDKSFSTNPSTIHSIKNNNWGCCQYCPGRICDNNCDCLYTPKVDGQPAKPLSISGYGIDYGPNLYELVINYTPPFTLSKDNNLNCPSNIIDSNKTKSSCLYKPIIDKNLMTSFPDSSKYTLRNDITFKPPFTSKIPNKCPLNIQDVNGDCLYAPKVDECGC